MLKITVRGQSVFCDCDLAASDSIGYLTANFNFSSDWTGLEKTAQFTQNGVTYNVLIQNDVCAVPAEISDGSVEISVFGQQAGGTKRITTVSHTVNIQKSGFVQDAGTPVPPTPDLYSQLLEKLNDAVNEVSQLYPEKLSELENDAGFITADEVTMPQKLSELENDAGFITADEVTCPTKLSELEQDITSLNFNGGIMTYSDKGIQPSGMSSFDINAYTLYLSGQDIYIGKYGRNVSLENLVTPTADTDAANKKYVDDKFSTSKFESLYVGNTQIYKDSGGNTQINGAANGQHDLDISAYNLSIDGYSVTIGNNYSSDWVVRIHKLVTPRADTDAANKKYVDDTVNTAVGDISTALDGIIALQLTFIGGETV